MVTGIELGWRKLGLPENAPGDAATAMIICATANRGQKGTTHDGATLPFTGKILHVAGGASYEIETRMQRLEPEWLGEKNSQVLAKGQAFLANPTTSWDASNQQTGTQDGAKEMLAVASPA